MKEPEWVARETVLALQEQSLADFGGIHAGIRDAGMLDSTLTRPANLFAYGKPTLFELAAGLRVWPCQESPIFRWQQARGLRNRNRLPRTQRPAIHRERSRCRCAHTRPRRRRNERGRLRRLAEGQFQARLEELHQRFLTPIPGQSVKVIFRRQSSHPRSSHS